MCKQDVIGELLYIGFVAEKGRCYGKKWRFGYKRVLKCHIRILSELLNAMIKEQVDMNSLIKKFIEECDNNPEIGKFYKISDTVRIQLDSKSINWEGGGCNYTRVNELMILLMRDLLKEVNNFIIKERNIYYLLNILHNLPRVYLGEEKKTICELNQINITEKDALQYAFQNMYINDKKI